MYSALKEKDKTPNPSPSKFTPPQASIEAAEHRGATHPVYTGIDSRIYGNLFILTLILDSVSMLVYGVNLSSLLIGCALSGVLVMLSGCLHRRRGD